MALAVADVAIGRPINGTVEIAGPEKVSLSALAARYLSEVNDPRTVISDENAKYFGAQLNEKSLVPGPNPRIGHIGFADWFATQTVKA